MQRKYHGFDNTTVFCGCQTAHFAQTQANCTPTAAVLKTRVGIGVLKVDHTFGKMNTSVHKSEY